MAIFRIKKRERKFVQIDKGLVNNPKVSMKAKGIMAYLLSKPDDWCVHKTDIVTHCTDGREAISSGIRELIDAKYINREKCRDINGQFAGYEYTVSETPDLTQKDTVDGKPVNGKPAATNNDISPTANKTEPEILPEDIFEQLDRDERQTLINWQTNQQAMQ